MKISIRQHTHLIRILVVFLFYATASVPVLGQITITSGDMPLPGDTVRKSNAVTTGSIDFTLTGENYNWDFSTLFPLFQNVDEYESVSSVPLLYQIFFPAWVANLAQKFPEADTLGLPITDPYRFFKNTSSSFTDVGFAITVSDFPVPLKFDNPDVIYDFPLSYGNVDSSFSGVEFGLPDLGFISIDRKRVNEVDGWGTLTTSYGTFDVLRLRSTVEETDSIYIDSISFGTSIDRFYTEYKWLAGGYPTPLLQVTEEGPVVTVAWTDSVFDPTTTIDEQHSPAKNYYIAPNPMVSDANVVVKMNENSPAEITIHNLMGDAMSRIFEGTLTRGMNKIPINKFSSNLRSGIYFVKIKTPTGVLTRKLIVR
jgi:hypothetical protein